MSLKLSRPSTPTMLAGVCFYESHLWAHLLGMVEIVETIIKEPNGIGHLTDFPSATG
ncbi:hypothetical protein C8J56DRAFT_1037669 [Mycena floridula]|nr:hypothetical protein C8J56DRAFT_1037669 [Mycena floridula]